MKNLKKVLSLVLALSMALSLMTVAFAADASDFKDYNEVKYDEAVDVMVAAGVFNGKDGNKFAPNDTLTREEAAKIVTYMMMGQKEADKLTTTVAPYADVAANRWSAGAIAWCTEQGILTGSNGKFYPTGKLTGLAFSKMLLVAMGYDAKIEKLEGSSWAINSATLAINNDLDKGMEKVSLSGNLTREQAALMAFNTMKADLVSYDNRGTEIKLSDGTTVIVGASKAEAVAQGKYDDNLKATSLQFAEKYCEDLKLTKGGSDVFENPAVKWNYKTTEVGVYSDKADLTYTTEVKLGDIYSDLGLSKSVAASNVTVYEDGAKGTAVGILKGSNDKIGGNGTLTSVYYDEDDATAIITLVNTYVGDVTAVKAETSTKDAYVTVIPRNAGKGGNFETTGFEVDDVVLFTYSDKAGDKGVQSVVKAEVLDGKVNAYTTGEKVTVDGKSYDYSAKVAHEAISTAKNYDVKLVLDSYGYAIDVDTENTTTNYAVVLKYNADGGKYGNDAIAQLLLTDGTVKDVTLTEAVDVTKGDIVTYKINNKDEYTLKVAADAEQKQGQLVENGVAKLTGKVNANGKTIFLVATKGGDDTVYTVYTGIKEVPTITASNKVTMSIALKEKTTDNAAVVYIDATENTTLSTSSKNVVFVLGDKDVKETEDSERGTFYTYDAVVNGEITKLDVKDAQNAPAFYTGISYDNHKVATLTGNIDKTKGDGIVETSAKKADDDVIGLGNKLYTYASDCQVFIVDGDRNINTSSVKAIGDKKSADGVKIFAKLTDGDVTTIVVVEKETTPETPTVDGKYTVKTAATVTAGSASGITVKDAVVYCNDKAPTDAIKGLTMNVTLKTYDNGSWNTYRTFNQDNVNIAASTGAVDQFKNTQAMPAGVYMIDVTLTGDTIGTLSLYSGTVNVQ